MVWVPGSPIDTIVGVKVGNTLGGLIVLTAVVGRINPFLYTVIILVSY